MIISILKKIIKTFAGRQTYVYILNTKIGLFIHDKLHSNSFTSRDFVLQALPKFSIGVEIGVNEGFFSERIIEIVQPKKFHLIDPWKFQQGEYYKSGEKIQGQEMMDGRFENVCKKFTTEIKKYQIVINRGTSEEILPKFDDGYFDWAYVDGNHSYNFVKKDLELCYMKVKNGGLITGDDYYDGERSTDGVKKAVDEFINSGFVQLIQLKNNQFILKKVTLT